MTETSQSLKILVLADNISSQMGGQERSLYDVCKGLANIGHRVHLLYDQAGDLLDDYLRDGVKVESLMKRGAAGQFSVNRNAFCRSSIALTRFLIKAAKINPDIVYINQLFDAVFPSLYASIRGKPLVCHLRLPPGPMCGQWRLALKQVSQFITISEQTKREYEAAGLPANRIEVVYNAVDPAHFKHASDPFALRSTLGIRPDAFVVGYCGRIDEGKGVDILLRGFAESGLAHRGGKLLVAGKPLNHADNAEAENFVARLQTLAKKLMISDHTYWLGHISNVESFYSTCNVIVLPSHGFNEPFGRVLIEAMACETPAIGSRLGGIPEVLRDEFSSFLFEPGNWRELGLLLRRTALLSASDVTLGKRCRKHVLRYFQLATMIERIDLVLKKTIETHNGNLTGQLPIE